MKAGQHQRVEARRDERGELDEIVAFGAYVHLERMADNWFCLIVESPKERVILNVGARRAPVWAHETARDAK